MKLPLRTTSKDTDKIQEPLPEFASKILNFDFKMWAKFQSNLPVCPSSNAIACSNAIKIPALVFFCIILLTTKQMSGAFSTTNIQTCSIAVDML